GFDFRTTGTGDALTFNLLHNQRMVSPHQVIVGAGSVRAVAMPFTVTSVPAYATVTGVGSGYDPVERVGGPREER
ncbi:MAG TPA: hypothetical protein VFH67_06925, partial [bacterium]|nr:hypothetical protein [bacterium]